MLTQSCFIKSEYKPLNAEGVGCPQYRRLLRIIRDYPFARQTLWQFGYSLVGGLQSVNATLSVIWFFPPSSCFITACVIFCSSPQSLHLGNFALLFLYCGCLCAEGFLEQRWEGLETKSSVKKGITQPEEPDPHTPTPTSLHSDTLGGWGICKGGAWEAITGICSPSDYSCQLKSSLQIIHVFI